MDENGLIYVIEDGIKYKLDGFTKTIVDEKKSKVFIVPLDKLDEEKAKETIDELMSDYKDAGEHKDKITLSDDELKEIKAIKKPRGWHFKDEFEDSEGNQYQKGKLVYVKKYDLKL